MGRKVKIKILKVGKSLPTCVMKRLKKFLLEFFLVFKAPQGIHGFEDIVIDEVISWNYVSLHHLHHWSLQLELTFTPSSNPGMSIDFLQLKKKD